MNAESGNCLTLEEIIASASGAGADPHRAHVESCPRCWARLVSYREFVSPSPAPESAGFDAARAAIGPALAREIGAERPRILAFPDAARRRDFGGKWLSAAAAVIAVGALAIAVARGPLLGERASVLRGDGASGAMGVASVALLAPTEAGGRVTLHWRAVPGAERYRVTFLGPDLAVLAALELGADTTLTLDPGRLPAALASAKAARYEVAALAGGSSIATSGVGTVRLP